MDRDDANEVPFGWNAWRQMRAAIKKGRIKLSACPVGLPDAGKISGRDLRFRG